jgi:ribonuclease PH
MESAGMREVDVDDCMLGISIMGISSLLVCRIQLHHQSSIRNNMTVPSADISVLHRADGSAQYSAAGYTVVAAVNGPLEVGRRDELPQHAALEVNVRPSVGVGSELPFPQLSNNPPLIFTFTGPKERHLESLIHSTLRDIVLTHMHPRTLIQLTLQIVNTPEQENTVPASFVRISRFLYIPTQH